MANLTPADSFDNVYQLVPTDKSLASVFNTVIQALLNRTQYLKNRLPIGIIVTWGGSADAIPSHWALCDGTNGTPDLRDRFIMGSGGSHALGSIGGSADAIVPYHNHNITDNGHLHNVSTEYNGTDGTQNGLMFPSGDSPGSETSQTASATTGITINHEGDSVTNANLPPYLVLCYIKLIG